LAKEVLRQTLRPDKCSDFCGLITICSFFAW